MKAILLSYIILLLLMYLPVIASGLLSGLELYVYWTLLALAALTLGWYHTRRWGE